VRTLSAGGPSSAPWIHHAPYLSGRRPFSFDNQLELVTARFEQEIGAPAQGTRGQKVTGCVCSMTLNEGRMSIGDLVHVIRSESEKLWMANMDEAALMISKRASQKLAVFSKTGSMLGTGHCFRC
jgi:hypothetical protein